MILENETLDDPLFYIGKLIDVDHEKILIKGFSGAANWDEEDTIVYYDDITVMQIETNYIKFYKDYFDQNSK